MMLRPALPLSRLSSYVVLALALALFLGWHTAPPPFAITFRFANEVIGPEPALDLVLPSVDPHGVVLAGATNKPVAASASRVAEIWVTLAESSAARRLAELSRTANGDRPVTGTCEISVAGQGGRKPLRYTVTGCYAKTVDLTGASRRVTLGYSAIKVSE
jgi:hypothetical protein